MEMANNVKELDFDMITCEICKRCFLSKESMTQHRKDHATCWHCITSFSDEATLLSHQQLHHLCTMCGKEYRHWKCLKLHILEHCDSKFDAEESTITRDGDAGKLFICSICSCLFSKKKLLWTHLFLHKGPPKEVCSLCGEEFRNLASLTKHMFRHNNMRNFECEVCKKQFLQSHHLKTHLRAQHPDSELLEQEKKVQRYVKLLKKVEPTREKLFPCHHCPKKFSDADSLSSHYLFQHLCTVCGKLYRYIPGLRVHLLSHATGTERGQGNYSRNIAPGIPDNILNTEEAKKFACAFCRSLFSEKALLLSHLAAEHKDHFKKLCPICGKQFTQATCLISHLKIHRGDRRHHCSLCKKHFLQGGQLKRHMAMHIIAKETGQESRVLEGVMAEAEDPKYTIRVGENNTKLYSCIKCGKTFPECKKSHLYLHFYTYCFKDSPKRYRRTGLKRRCKNDPPQVFQCKVCSLMIRSQAALDRHLIVKHELHLFEDQVSASSCKDAVSQNDEIDCDADYVGEMSNVETSFHCSKCGMPFRSATELLSHEKENHGTQ